MKTATLTLAAGLCLAAVALADAPGKILILDNELLIEGEVRRDRDQYVVRRGSGETIIPASRVIDVVPDRRHAYLAMSARCNRRDFDDRMHLIHWCMEQGLRAEALAEAESLRQFRPEDAGLTRLVDGLRTLVATKAEPSDRTAAAPAKLPDSVLEVEPLDVSREAFGMFVAKVQPILMNLCARCHAAGDGGRFTLESVIEGSERKAALHNLAATLKQLKRNGAVASPLLEKALTAHGKALEPPLRDRQALAYQNLEAWAQLAAPRGEAPTAAPERPVEGAAPAPAVSKPLEAPAPARFVSKPPPPAPKLIFGETSASQTRPEPQTEARDPFDPAIFNGTIQPKK
jgi:hypothetical protein